MSTLAHIYRIFCEMIDYLFDRAYALSRKEFLNRSTVRDKAKRSLPWLMTLVFVLGVIIKRCLL